METRWTPMQEKVINTRDRNILVSAAAGSGKTAVLVERILKLVMDEQNPIDVDKLLIVTFTNAAAAEMRERILKALDAAHKKNPENEHLQKQMTYIHNAKITTIDSFCLNILKEHFSEVNVEPGFRIGDMDELALLRADVLEDILDEHYLMDDEEFQNCMEDYLSKSGMSNIEEVINSLYTESMSYPYPKEWLDSLTDNYENADKEKIINSNWFKLILDEIKDGILAICENYKLAVSLIITNENANKYLDLFTREKKYFDELSLIDDFKTLQAKADFNFDRLPSIGKKDNLDEDVKAQIQGYRKDSKNIYQKLCKKYLNADFDQIAMVITGCAASVKTIISLTKELIDKFGEVKREKNLIDFADVEHFALEILLTRNGNKIEPSETAMEISKDFYEIMIDEYQDSNYVQEYILNSVSKSYSGKNNVFMVGDVKQSIYRFRQSKPELFLQKYDTYTEDGIDFMKICLSKNFRSRHEVLDFANLVFSQLMVKELGGISYDKDSALYVGASYLDNSDMNTEIIIIDSNDSTDTDNDLEQLEDMDKDDEASRGKEELEAHAIIDLINRMMSSLNVTDKKTRNLRPLKFSDIAILLRSNKGLGDTINNCLEENGIPVDSITQTGYFNAFEVKTILSYLSIIDNPNQDIPLVSVLKNIYEFNENELALIKCNQTGLMYDAVKGYIGPLETRIGGFLKDLSDFRQMVPYTTIYSLINEILSRTGFLDYIKAMTNGVRRVGNIDMLLDRAINFERGSYSGLFNFVRYIEKIKKYEIDQGESALATGNESVKLMTIHKSKGLEFPVVILAGTGKQINQMDMKKKVVVNNELGLGVDYIDSSTNIRYKSLIKEAVNRKNTYETMAEELRVLYVALTRAKEKLVIVGSTKVDSIVKKCEAVKGIEKLEFGNSNILKCKSYLEWIMLSQARCRSMTPLYNSYGYGAALGSDIYDLSLDTTITIRNISDMVYSSVEKKFMDYNIKNVLLSLDSTREYDVELRKTISNNLEYEYMFLGDTTLKAKVSVSDVKHANMQMSYDEDGSDVLLFDDVDKVKDEEDEDAPEFIKHMEINQGARRGTAYHRVFELFDYNMDIANETDIGKMIAKMIEEGKIDQADAMLVDTKKMYKFTTTNIGKRMKEAAKNGKLYREKQFVMGEDSKTIWKETNSKELILVQGIIDAMFEENGQAVIVDYKTDSVKKLLDLKARYETQLKLYAKAVEESIGMKVKELAIYSTKFGEELILEN